MNTSLLARIGWPSVLPEAWAPLLQAHPAARPVRVVEQHRSGYVVADGSAQCYPADSLPEWQRRHCDPLQRPTVGDWVLVEGEAARARIVALLPRYSLIKRAAAGEHYRQQLIAANIDTAFVVTGLDADFNPRRIERYLLLLKGSGVTPVVVLTKQDIAEDAPAALMALTALAEQGVAVMKVNAKDAQSVAVLAPWLGGGCTVALVGSSGAGKSTLGNTLLGEARMKTGAVRAHDARGRHTTTHRTLFSLPQGGCLIDTPGMRELKPTGEERLDSAAFADIEQLARACRFRDCRHQHEPGCAVCAAIDAGQLDAARLGNYRKLAGELAEALKAQKRRQRR